MDTGREKPEQTPIPLETLLLDDQFKAAYEGNYSSYFTTQDEAEKYLAATLFESFYPVGKVREIMAQSKTGKWNDNSKGPEKQKSYQDRLLKSAQTQAKEESKSEYEEQESQADKIYKLFCDIPNVELFHDQNKTEYAHIPIESPNGTNGIFAAYTSDKKLGNTATLTPPLLHNCENSVNAVNGVSQPHMEIIKLDSEDFKNYLAHLLFKSESKIPYTEAKAQVISLLKFDATQGKCYHLYNRVAPDPSGDGSIWLDIADKNWRAYHITKDGWTIETTVPILFKREEHQRPLVEATKNGDIEPLLKFMNIGAGNTPITKRRLLLLKIQTASYFIPEIPHPINAMFGCPGSHKSCTQRYIRSIIDPSSAPLQRIPRDETAALQVLDHHYIPIFDQIFYMPQWFSDILCSAVTGAGQESRLYYTNDEPFIRAFKRCIMLNGVNIPATKGDLLSRSILHPTEPQENRLTEKELDTEYNNVLPSILGGFLDVIVKTLNFFGTPEAKPTKPFRMADFTEWGCALSLALGETVEEFIIAMTENLNSQVNHDIENNNVAEAFLAYFNKLEFFSLSEKEPLKKTPAELLKELQFKAEELGTNTKNAKKWPSVPSVFTRKLNDSKNSIISNGWNYDIFHDGEKRVISIWRIKPTPKTPEPPQGAVTEEAIQQTISHLYMLRSQHDNNIPIDQIENQNVLRALLRDGKKVFNVDDKHVRID